MSSCFLSSLVNRGRTSSFLLHGPYTAHISVVSSNSSDKVTKSSVNASFSYYCSVWSSSIVSIKHTSSVSSSTDYIFFLLRWKILSSSVIFPKLSCITPFRQFMIALEVAKNGLPRIIGTKLAPTTTGSVSRTTKSTG